MSPVSLTAIVVLEHIVSLLAVVEERVVDINILLSVSRHRPSSQRNEMSAAARPAYSATERLIGIYFSAYRVKLHTVVCHIAEMPYSAEGTIQIPRLVACRRHLSATIVAEFCARDLAL